MLRDDPQVKEYIVRTYHATVEPTNSRPTTKANESKHNATVWQLYLQMATPAFRSYVVSTAIFEKLRSCTNVLQGRSRCFLL